jgi:cell division ATPase FtsA
VNLILISDEVFSLTREAFNSAIASLIEETIDCCEQLLRSASIDWQQVNQMLLVGGSCRIPYVREAINRRFGRQPLLVDEPELAVCLGAAIYGNLQDETQVKQAEQKAKVKAELQRKRQEEAKRQSQLEAQEKRQRRERERLEAEARAKAEAERKRLEEEEESKTIATPVLKSARGVDYTKLRDLLAAGEWKAADQETVKVMCQAAGRTSEGWLDTLSIDEKFPCEDLRTINQLWLHYRVIILGITTILTLN